VIVVTDILGDVDWLGQSIVRWGQIMFPLERNRTDYSSSVGLGVPLDRKGEDEGEVCRITSLPGFDDPTGGCPRTQHNVGGQGKAVRRGGADGFAV
jgi:hypothetical protein